MKKLIFVDVDGTLILPDQSIPPLSANAIKSAQAKGNKIFLATGRSNNEITNDLRALNFDGYIGAGGGYIEIDNAVIYHNTMNPKEVKRIVDFFYENSIDFYMDTNHGTYSTSSCVNTIRDLFQEYNKDNVDYKEPTDFFEILTQFDAKEAPLDKINKISFISKTFDYDKVYREFCESNTVIHYTVFEFGKNSGEIGPKGTDKYSAIQIVKEYYNNEYKTYAIGNGHNDISMFKAVDHAIAMGNSPIEVIEHADEVTETLEKNGFYESFKRNNLF